MSFKREVEFWELCLAVGLLMLPAGCDRHGRERFDLKGNVSYGGQTVPAGYIVFTPDAAAGNAGPGAQADIRAGKYFTNPGLGTIGGPHVVRIFAFDGKSYTPTGSKMPLVMGHPLFSPYTVKVDLPKQASVFDFTIPKN